MTLLKSSPPIIHNVIQGSEEWLRLRRGIITASTIGELVTPSKLTFAANDKSRARVRQLLAERLTDFIEPSFYGEHMERGHEDEAHMRAEYERHTGRTVELVGFVTREFVMQGQNGPVTFTIGCSPDGLVGERGMIEGKSRLAKHQAGVILQDYLSPEHRPQVQFALLVTGRQWCDYVSYCGGMPLAIYTESVSSVGAELLAAACAVEEELYHLETRYRESVTKNGWPMTERHTQASDEIQIGEDE